MPETNIGATERSDLTQEFITQADVDVKKTYKVDAVDTDAAFDQPETEYLNSHWAQYLGYYKQIPELQVAIDAVATWTVGKGFEADEPTTTLLDTISGWGKDTFNSILENLIRTYHIGGDAFAEIIRDDNKIIINLKPLDPGVMKTVVNRQGRIIRYEQINKVKSETRIKKFQPEQIFHLSRNRVADEIHGQSIISAVEKIILMRNEIMDDWRRVLHRNIDPVTIYHLDTDDPGEIATFKKIADTARGKGENLYIPKGAVEIDKDALAPNESLNPLATIELLNQYFFQAVGVPDIIVGSSKVLTEASAKIAYLAFEQRIKEEQLFVEEEMLAQLNIEIKLVFPASLKNELISDEPQEPEVEAPTGVEPNDTTAETEGRK